MRLDEIVRCPKCKGSLISQGVDYDIKSHFCPACGLSYPVIDGVVDFLPEGYATRGRGQRLMESPLIVNIYESRWWRGCGLFKWFAGLTLDEEMALIMRIARPGDDDVILDLACGTGLYTRAFALGNARRAVFGLDISWPMLKYATVKARQMGLNNIRFLHGDAHSLPFADESLDVANCCGALHLFTDVGQVLRELHRALRPGGKLSAAAAWNAGSAWSRLKAYLDERLWNIHYFTKEEIAGLLEEAGFIPAVYHSYGIWIAIGGVRK